METKLITKTIKELADEYDGNVEQLHRAIAGYEKLTRDQKKEIEAINFEIENQKYAIEIAEKKSEVSTFVMMLCLIVSTIAFVINMLFIG